MGDLRERGAAVTDVLCIVDRRDGDAGALAGRGLQVHALFTADELAGAADRAQAVTRSGGA